MLLQYPDGLPLVRCLPPLACGAANRTLRIRAALASTLLAGLELAREGRLELDQATPFAAIRLRPATAPAVPAETAA